MSTDQPDSADGSSDRDAFKTELGELIEHACEAAVSIKGGHEVRTSWSNQPDYTIEISGVTSLDD